MGLVPLKFPPGITRLGTRYESAGRWYDSQLVRWHEGVLQPVGGWSKMQYLDGLDEEDIDLGEVARGMFAWRDNAGVPYFAVGTPTSLHVFRQMDITDITPAVALNGEVDESGSSTGLIERREASDWQFDAFGEYLVAQFTDIDPFSLDTRGRLLYWDPVAGGDAAPVTNAPSTFCGVVVTPERFLMALGAGDLRNVAWADQESLDVWTATSTNQAGEFPLSTPGRIMGGRPSQTETLIWTDTDIWAARYIGGTLVYRFDKVGDSCGVVSRRAMQVFGSKAIWMGARSFFMYDGFTRPISCSVSDYVFNDINRAQLSKVWVMHFPEFQEVRWHYPSSASTECNRYVAFKYTSGEWTIGALQRTAGTDAEGIFPYPLMGDASGFVYEHEKGSTWLDHNGDAMTPYVESGPFELGAGDNTFDVLEIIPDDKTVGDVTMTLYSTYYPDEAETTRGPYTLTKRTDARFNCRQVRVKLSQVNAGWRFGVARLNVVPAGRR